MSQHDFTQIFNLYPALIQQMPDVFTSHEFILRLAQQHQALYIEALHAYHHTQNPTPFMTVHGILAKRLNAFPQLVTHLGEVESIDIFTQENRCAQWQRVQPTR